MSAVFHLSISSNDNKLSFCAAALTKWERSLRTYAERTGGSAVPHEWKLPILFQMIPTNMMSEIKIKHKYTTGPDKSYEGFSRLLIEMANERTYDRRAAKGRGENDMDLDALAAEKAELQAAYQAELQAQDDEDYGEEREYSAAEWLEWESQLQEELNWLGSKSIKMSPKTSTTSQ